MSRDVVDDSVTVASVRKLDFETEVSSSARGMVFAVLLIVLTLVLWSFFGTVDDVVQSVARVSLAQEIATVRSPFTGKVLEVAAAHGTRVAAGDIVWRVDARLPTNDLELATTLIEGLQVRREEVLSVIGALEANNAELADSRPIAHFLARSHVATYRQLELAAETAKAAWDRARRSQDALRVESEVAELYRAYESALADAEAYFANTLANLSLEVRELDRQIVDATRSRNSADVAIQNSFVRAPVSGTIEYLQPITPGEWVLQGTSVARIVPGVMDAVEVRIEVPDTDAGRVQLGNTVRLEFLGAPGWEFGTFETRIEYISEHATIGSGGDRYFEAMAAGPDSHLIGLGDRRVTLRSGMTARAFIEVGTRPIYTIIFEWATP